MSLRSLVSRRAADAAGRLDLATALGPRLAADHRRCVRASAAAWNLRAGRLYQGIWRAAATEIGAEAVELSPGAFAVSRAGRSTRVVRWVTELDELAAVERSRDCTAVQHMLRANGLPVPEQIDFRAADPRPAFAFLGDGAQPCVIKPAGGTGAGYGVTCGVRHRRDLVRADLQAARFTERLAVERQAPGAMYRMLVLDGELIAVVRRNPPSVTGDGGSNVGELIAAENRRRLAAGGHEGLSPLRVDIDCLLALRAAGLGVRSVLARGARVIVKTSSSDSGRADNETVDERLCGELIEEVVAAARLTRLRLAGIDVVTPDLRRGLQAVGGALVEVNATPGLHHHYLVPEAGARRHVAVPILRRLLE